MMRVVVVGVLVLGCCRAGEIAPDFAREVRPILSDRCFTCHGPDEKARKAKLRLDTAAGALATREHGAAVVPGKPAASSLIARLTTADEDEVMPPAKGGKRLSAAEIATLTRWIAAGAPWGEHWAFVPPRAAPAPVVKNPAWPRTEIDRFVLARLERDGLAPAAEADRRTLIRRLALDLTGLPPDPDLVEAFVADRSPDAYDQLVDRLLASPRYGEHLALSWLDAARYADSNGYQGDADRSMWPWRDWVVEAFNANLPWDRFTIVQLAGDLLPDATDRDRLATGFNRNHMINNEGGRIAEESRIDYVMDRAETVATVWLGATFTCARCHDHKYDPYTQRDYYRLFAYFNNVAEKGGGAREPVLRIDAAVDAAELVNLRATLLSTEAELNASEPRIAGEFTIWLAALDAAAIAKLPKPVLDAASVAADQRSAAQTTVLSDHHRSKVSLAAAVLVQRIAEDRKRIAEREKGSATVLVMDDKSPRKSHILTRGAWDKKGDEVTAGTPSALPAPAKDTPANRLGLARWLVDAGNPLTARVTVNRFWQHCFGAGLVRTPEDFGAQSRPPTHPELLDTLAVRFVESGWDVKALLRLLVRSATYRQSSQVTAAALERDPTNELLARAPRHRLAATALRDQALAVGGLLVERRGGPPVKPYQPAGLWEEFSFGKIKYVQDHGESLRRRSLYTFWRRTVPPTNLFDSASRQLCAVGVRRTNTPLQALVLMNDITYVEAARGLAERVLAGPGDDAARWRNAFTLATCRPPSADESARLGAALARMQSVYASDAAGAKALIAVGEHAPPAAIEPARLAAWTMLCSLLLNLDEVVSRE